MKAFFHDVILSCDLLNLPLASETLDFGLVGAKLKNATSDFFELDLSKKHSPVKWLP